MFRLVMLSSNAISDIAPSFGKTAFGFSTVLQAGATLNRNQLKFVVSDNLDK